MEKTKAQQKISKRREAIYKAYTENDIPVSLFVRSMAVKHGVTEVTVYGDILDAKLIEYIDQKSYTWTIKSIKAEYKKFKNNEYVSHSAKDVIHNVILKNK